MPGLARALASQEAEQAAAAAAAAAESAGEKEKGIRRETETEVCMIGRLKDQMK